MFYINFKVLNLILKSPIGEQKRDILLYLTRESITNKKHRLEFLSILHGRLIEYFELVNIGFFIEIDGESRYGKEIFTDWNSATDSFNSRLCEAIRDNKYNETYNKNWVRVTYKNVSVRFRYDLNHTYNTTIDLKKFMIADIEYDISYFNKNGDPFNEIPFLKNAKKFIKSID
jgi:hypothetical protein